MNGQQHNSKVRRRARRTTRLGNNGIGLNSTATNGNNETSTDPIESLNNLEQQLQHQMTTFNIHLRGINECAVNIANVQEQLAAEISKVRKVNEEKDAQILQLTRHQNTNARDIQSPSESTIQVNILAAANANLELHQANHAGEIPVVPAGIGNFREEDMNATLQVENVEDNQPGPSSALDHVPRSTSSTTHPQYECHICKRTFKVKCSFEMHLLRFGLKPVELECTICDQTFRAESILEQHIRNHSVQTQYQCNLCNNYFERVSDLILQIRAHTVRKRPYVCTFCPATFSTPILFRDHQKKHSFHVSCTQCYKIFRTKERLASHLAKIHRI